MVNPGGSCIVVCCCGGLTISCGVTSLCCAGGCVCVCAGLMTAVVLAAGLTGAAVAEVAAGFALLSAGVLLWLIRAPCWTNEDTDVPFPFCAMLAMMWCGSRCSAMVGVPRSSAIAWGLLDTVIVVLEVLGGDDADAASPPLPLRLWDTAERSARELTLPGGFLRVSLGLSPLLPGAGASDAAAAAAVVMMMMLPCDFKGLSFSRALACFSMLASFGSESGLRAAFRAFCCCCACCCGSDGESTGAGSCAVPPVCCCCCFALLWRAAGGSLWPTSWDSSEPTRSLTAFSSTSEKSMSSRGSEAPAMFALCVWDGLSLLVRVHERECAVVLLWNCGNGCDVRGPKPNSCPPVTTQYG